ncbi:SRPBCC family protein [Amycolatopsis sp.]|uniref:SRPBCC family protein n=1 Tax=Amycolatopsis sp. TaxID=37632 RepID=UPI002BCE3361|nr:SRPBCC family protein [Amycolatopsis sp.]HVV08230.1 SRPBCC family protein [Amycolatopsis sp.]
MATVTRSVSISAPPEKILGILFDVERHPGWQKEVDKVEVLERDESGRPRRTRTTVQAMGQQATYVVEYDHSPPSGFEYHLVEGDVMMRNDFAFSVEPGEGGASEAVLSQAIDIKWPLPKFMIEKLAAKGVQDMLDSLKARAEGG